MFEPFGQGEVDLPPQENPDHDDVPLPVRTRNQRIAAARKEFAPFAGFYEVADRTSVALITCSYPSNTNIPGRQFPQSLQHFDDLVDEDYDALVAHGEVGGPPQWSRVGEHERVRCR